MVPLRPCSASSARTRRSDRPDNSRSRQALSTRRSARSACNDAKSWYAMSSGRTTGTPSRTVTCRRSISVISWTTARSDRRRPTPFRRVTWNGSTRTPGRSHQPPADKWESHASGPASSTAAIARCAGVAGEPTRRNTLGLIASHSSEASRRRDSACFDIPKSYAWYEPTRPCWRSDNKLISRSMPMHPVSRGGMTLNDTPGSVAPRSRSSRPEGDKTRGWWFCRPRVSIFETSGRQNQKGWGPAPP